jgi:uncharacterized protein (DUF433 family)
MSIDAKSPAVERVPGVMGGSPVIKGTRIRVSDLVHYWQNCPDDATREILEGFPHLTSAQIDAAYSYYTENKAEIDREAETDKRIAAEWQRRQGSI